MRAWRWGDEGRSRGVTGRGSGFLLIISLGMEIIHLGQEDPLEEGMATYPSILAWEIPWMEEAGGL